MGGTDFDDVGNQSKFWNTTNTSTTTPPAGPASALGYIPGNTWNDSCATAGTSGCTATIISRNSSSGIDLVTGSSGTKHKSTHLSGWSRRSSLVTCFSETDPKPAGE